MAISKKKLNNFKYNLININLLDNRNRRKVCKYHEYIAYIFKTWWKPFPIGMILPNLIQNVLTQRQLLWIKAMPKAFGVKNKLIKHLNDTLITVTGH